MWLGFLRSIQIFPKEAQGWIFRPPHTSFLSSWEAIFTGMMTEAFPPSLPEKTHVEVQTDDRDQTLINRAIS